MFFFASLLDVVLSVSYYFGNFSSLCLYVFSLVYHLIHCRLFLSFWWGKLVLENSAILGSQVRMAIHRNLK